MKLMEFVQNSMKLVKLMAPMAGEELNVDWYGNVGAPHCLRIIET